MGMAYVMGVSGNRIREVREQRGYTQEELAELLGVGALQLYRWENEKTDPSSTYVSKLAKFLGVSADYLLGLVDEPNQHRTESEENLSQMERKLLMAVRSGLIYEALELVTSLTKGDDQSSVTPDKPAVNG